MYNRDTFLVRMHSCFRFSIIKSYTQYLLDDSFLPSHARHRLWSTAWKVDFYWMIDRARHIQLCTWIFFVCVVHGIVIVARHAHCTLIGARHFSLDCWNKSDRFAEFHQISFFIGYHQFSLLPFLSVQNLVTIHKGLFHSELSNCLGQKTWIVPTSTKILSHGRVLLL